MFTIRWDSLLLCLICWLVCLCWVFDWLVCGMGNAWACSCCDFVWCLFVVVVFVVCVFCFDIDYGVLVTWLLPCCFVVFDLVCFVDCMLCHLFG